MYYIDDLCMNRIALKAYEIIKVYKSMLYYTYRKALTPITLLDEPMNTFCYKKKGIMAMQGFLTSTKTLVY